MGARGGTSRDDKASAEAVEAIVFWILLFLVSVHLVLLAVVAGVPWIRQWAGRTVVILVGLTLVAVGNLLPRTRPNVALGIRTSRTVLDRHLWTLTHRAGGYVCVGVGLVIVFAGLFLAGQIVAGVAAGAGLIGAAVWFASYQRFTRAR